MDATTRRHHDMLCRAITHRQQLMARGLSREAADAMPSATSMRRSLRVERRTSMHAGGRTVPRTLPTMSMPIMLRSGILAARVSQVDALADHGEDDVLQDGGFDVHYIVPADAGESPTPPDLQAAAAALNIVCLSLTPRLAAAPSIRARVFPRARLSPCESSRSG